MRRRLFLTGSMAAPLLALRPARALAAGGIVTPEMFGAKGDGVTNDTAAFAAMSRHIAERGGGEIVLQRKTYIVGSQRRALLLDPGYAFEPSPIMDFVGLTAPLIIRGNGAKLKCAPGLRYGTFNRATGARTDHAQPYYKTEEIATPYRAMIRAERCAASIDIADLELDGSLGDLLMGGPYGDTGWQIAAVGLMLVDNRGPERISGLYSHHHAQDGVQIDGLDEDRPAGSRSQFENVHCTNNARQGLSFVGGRHYAFRRCIFAHTGKSRFYSAPGAGVDIEAEKNKKVRDLSFSTCSFVDNIGCGLVADQGDSADVAFDGCRFIGTTSWAAWPNKPGFRFNKCVFAGPIVNAHGDAQPARACQFVDCLFTDDPALSPTKALFGGANTDRPIADLPFSRNVRFTHCRFDLRHAAVLPWTTNQVIFDDCVMQQVAPRIGYPRGTFIGTNRIDGKVDLYSAIIRGTLTVNGKVLPRTAA